MPSRALELIGALGLLAAALASVAEANRRARLRALAYVAGAVAMAFALPSAWTALQLSPYKGLSQALRVPGAVVEVERSSPLGLLSAVRSPEIPFRHAPGLSLNNLIEPAAQIGVFTDGESLSPITAFAGDLEPLGYLDFTTAALPYHLLERPKVLVLGAGAGAQVLLALLPWRNAHRRGRAEPAAGRAGPGPLRRVRRQSVRAPRGPGAHRRGARLRGGRRGPLRSDPGAAARRVCRRGRRHRSA